MCHFWYTNFRIPDPTPLLSKPVQGSALGVLMANLGCFAPIYPYTDSIRKLYPGPRALLGVHRLADRHGAEHKTRLEFHGMGHARLAHATIASTWTA